MRILNFSYSLYNLVLFAKIPEVVIKKFIKFIICSSDLQKKRFFWERLGIVSNVSVATNSGNWIWVHANAIGEVGACQHLLRLLRSKYPNQRILLTTSNFSADAMAFQLNIADAVIFFPYDIPLIINKLLNVFKVVSVIILECDLRPNFVKVCKDRKISVFIISGIFNNNGCRSLGILHLYDYKFLLNDEVLGMVDYFFMQTEDDKNRLSAILPKRRNISVTGDLKLCSRREKELFSSEKEYRKIFRISNEELVFIAGSIHIEEFPEILDTFISIKQKFSSVVMIVAPRFLEDVGRFEFILHQKDVNFYLRTQLSEHLSGDKDVIILNTLGELSRVYALADIAFVGGSLTYLGEAFGGHNILEAAMAGVPVIFGPYMHNFRSLADLFLKRHAAIEVMNSAELINVMNKLLSDKNQSQQMIANANAILEEHKDVSSNTFLSLSEWIDDERNY